MQVIRWLVLLVALALADAQDANVPPMSHLEREILIRQAYSLLEQAGAQYLCDPMDFVLDSSSHLPPHRLRRQLVNVEAVETEIATNWTSLILASLCICAAAFCAGLILGILSLDELMLHIKIRAGTDPLEQEYAQKLLPLVQNRHLVLVSLLLLNFLADEALPLFLDDLMPSWAAVATSVVLVVFVSEIIPSAIFIGPDQLRLASKISPFAYVVMFVFYPVASPIARLLDYLLKDEDESGNVYNRGELSALVRIQYESRMAAKRRELKERRLELGIVDTNDDDQSDESLPRSIQFKTDETIQTAEVNMLEGALALKTTTARDVCTKIRKAYTVPHDMILDQSNVARIYGVGYSRVPVYHRNRQRPGDTSRIIGILMTRQLILVDTSHRRKVSTLPLYQPTCVSPDSNMIELLQIFQGGSSGNKGGHMALVCERPGVAEASLDQGKPIPHEAGVVGIITMEDVMEELLQEPIYDEGDRAERQAMERAEWAFRKWRLFVKRRKRQREALQRQGSDQAIILQGSDDALPDPEMTPLVGNRRRKSYGSESDTPHRFLPNFLRPNMSHALFHDDGGDL